MTNCVPDSRHCAVRLRETVSSLSRRLRPNPQRDGISAAKLSVIAQLYRGGPMTPTDLAGREGVKLQSLTRLLAELESDGWVTRKTHASDRRQSLLTLTPRGVARLTAAVRARVVVLAKIIETSLDADQRALLLDACALFDRIGDALDGRADEMSAPAIGVRVMHRGQRS